MRKVLIAGCGYVGTQVSVKEQKVGASITALVKHTASVKRLKASGISVHIVDLDDSRFHFCPDSHAFDCLYYFIAPQRQGRIDKRSRNFIANYLLRIQTQRIVLISTTAVYGDCHGRWIDEAEPVEPKNDRGYRRLDAEQQWQKLSKARNVPLTILRVAGIYGSEKLPLNRLQRGEPVLSRSDSPWSNRIYVKDLADICHRFGIENYSDIFNVTDGSPSSMTEYFFQIAKKARIEQPREISLEVAKRELGEGILSYLQESKRIRNNKMLETLGIQLRFPTLELGLDDIDF